jgi:hypothetical protein
MVVIRRRRCYDTHESNRFTIDRRPGRVKSAGGFGVRRCIAAFWGKRKKGIKRCELENGKKKRGTTTFFLVPFFIF